MDKLLGVLVSWQAILLSFCAFAVVGVVRASGTRKDKDGKVVGGWAQSRLFKSLLPVLPYVFTLSFVFIPGTPIPKAAAASVATKILYGILTGWLSDKSYQIVKTAMERGLNIKLDSKSGS